MNVLIQSASALVFVGLLLGMENHAHAQSVAEARVASIDWDRAYADSARFLEGTSALKAFREQNAQVLNSIRLPVLMSGVLATETAPRLKGKSNSYVVAYKLSSARLSIFGTSAFLVRTDDEVYAQSGTMNTPKFERSDDGSDISFFRYGASYVMRLSCFEQEDERCAKEEFLSSLVGSLGVIGGKDK